MSETKTIFISGAAAGIGEQAARLFHARGYAVGLFDINVEGATRLASQLGARALAGALDVTDHNSFVNALTTFDAYFGRLDVLLNNAGVLRMGAFADVPLEMHHRTIDVNVKGVINAIAAALPQLRATAKKHGEARIINMCSASSIYGTPEHSTYSASKFAVRGLTEALSVELRPDGILVSDILPSYTDTGMVRDQAAPSRAFGKLGVAHTPEQIAELIWRSASGDQLHRFGNVGIAFADRFARAMPMITRAIAERLK